MPNPKWDINKKTQWSIDSIAYTINDMINQQFNSTEENNIAEVQEILIDEFECTNIFDVIGFTEITLSELNEIMEQAITVFVDRRS